ncbi:hypothetical protein Ancab_016642 [Ancistrocladus abbreviatus]
MIVERPDTDRSLNLVSGSSAGPMVGWPFLPMAGPLLNRRDNGIANTHPLLSPGPHSEEISSKLNQCLKKKMKKAGMRKTISDLPSPVFKEESLMQRLRQRSNMDYCIAVGNGGQSGGLALLWNGTANHKVATIDSVVLIGDWNAILDHSKKWGGRQVTGSSQNVFKNILDRAGLLDLGYIGDRFT